MREVAESAMAQVNRHGHEPSWGSRQSRQSRVTAMIGADIDGY